MKINGVSLRLIPAHAGKTRRSRSARPARPAHPRSRGENGPHTNTKGRPGGSSPLTRGKRQDRRAGQNWSWLIPAHAGKTRLRELQSARNTAHPRSRGENWFAGQSSASQAGSSPLTRGKQSGPARRCCRRGIIPAHAGKTISVTSRPPDRGDHPRSRGENPRHRFVIAPCDGSSPLTRGKHRGRARGPDRAGIIPAHAGKTEMGGIEPPAGRDHPRSRGENLDPVYYPDW